MERILIALGFAAAAAVAYFALQPKKKVLDPKKKISLKLLEKESLSHDVRRFRFALPKPDDVLGLPTCKHIYVSCMKDGKLLSRPYTPVSSNDDLGYVDFMLKIYPPAPPRFPQGGMMSQHLDSLKVGDSMDFRGPIGRVEYKGRGVFEVPSANGVVSKRVSHIGLMAGGTGITPALAVIRAVMKDSNDDLKISLIFANKTEPDIFLRSELEECQRLCPNFKLWYTLDDPPADWKYSKGFIDQTMIEEHMPVNLPSNSLILCCGPPPMVKFACKANLEKIGYPMENVVTF